MKLKIMILIMSLMVSSVASAAFTSTVKISRVALAWGSTGMFITTTGSKINPAGCSSTGSYLMRDVAGATAYNRYIAMALSAQANDSGLRLFIDDNDCQNGYPKILSIYLYR